jgi:hypothetical protein
MKSLRKKIVYALRARIVVVLHIVEQGLLVCDLVIMLHLISHFQHRRLKRLLRLQRLEGEAVCEKVNTPPPQLALDPVFVDTPTQRVECRNVRRSISDQARRLSALLEACDEATVATLCPYEVGVFLTFGS